MKAHEKIEKRIENRLPIAWEGFPFVLLELLFTIVLLYLEYFTMGIVIGLLCAFTLYFFRDPERKISVDENAVLAPADGKILEIKRLNDSDNLLGEPAFKISIFMSVFNVHVNRIPTFGKITKIAYYPGTFFSANLDKASKKNERNSITLETAQGHKILFVQIAGLIARRIACWVKEGDHVEAGQRFGLIRFGSRLDVYLPLNTRIVAEADHHVKAGQTLLGYLS